MILQLPGYCQIPLWERVPTTWNSKIWNSCDTTRMTWRICDYTTVDSDNYRRLNQDRWLRERNYRDLSRCHVYRHERLHNGMYVKVLMAREVLGLPRGIGYGGDEAVYVKQDQTLKNTRDNLRVVTSSWKKHRRKGDACFRFSGIYDTNRCGWQSLVTHNYQGVRFPCVKTDVEAALMYNYGAYILRGDLRHLNEIPENEIPVYERQLELYGLVVTKLMRVGLLVVA